MNFDMKFFKKVIKSDVVPEWVKNLSEIENKEAMTHSEKNWVKELGQDQWRLDLQPV